MDTVFVFFMASNVASVDDSFQRYAAYSHSVSAFRKIRVSTGRRVDRSSSWGNKKVLKSKVPTGKIHRVESLLSMMAPSGSWMYRLFSLPLLQRGHIGVYSSTASATMVTSLRSGYRPTDERAVGKAASGFSRRFVVTGLSVEEPEQAITQNNPNPIKPGQGAGTLFLRHEDGA